MIVDTSAVVAMVMGEPESDGFFAAVRSEPARMSAGTYVECAIVLDRRRPTHWDPDLDPFIRSVHIDVVPLTAAHARLAREAYRDFGKGSGHPAQLNFGDCFAYALAVETGEALLYKGEDFVHTGVASAL